MPEIELRHFVRAAKDIGAHGDNDTLPFDLDTRFVKDKAEDLARLAYDFYTNLLSDDKKNSKERISSLAILSERIMVSAGTSGFRTSTKIPVFWNLYLNGLGVGIAEALEVRRSQTAYSYRYLPEDGVDLFEKKSTWRSYKEASVASALNQYENAIVVQTDISSFYDHISHHYIENLLSDLFPSEPRIAVQINALLGKFTGGRSFGLPVGGQCARVLAELLLNEVDHNLTANGVVWHRYVDDYILVAPNHSDAYRSVATLSKSLSDYGLTLSKTKTILLSAKHYSEYVEAQLGSEEDEAQLLREIDIHFDPYSDTSEIDYESLRDTVESLQVQKLLNRELEKALPDNFLVTQISRTLTLQESDSAIQLCNTLLSAGNLYAFRASWSSIMRGVATLRATDEHSDIFEKIDRLLDEVPNHSSHLLQVDGNLLHYIRTLRFRETTARRIFLNITFSNTQKDFVRKMCIDCWRSWKQRFHLTQLRNDWNTISAECKKISWIFSYEMGDEGDGMRRQLEPSFETAVAIGIERRNARTFGGIYKEWARATTHTA